MAAGAWREASQPTEPFAWWAVPVRNGVFLAWVLVHAARRLLPRGVGGIFFDDLRHHAAQRRTHDLLGDGVIRLTALKAGDPRAAILTQMAGEFSGIGEAKAGGNGGGKNKKRKEKREY